MRILLIATNRHNRLQSRMNAQPLPIGLAYIAGHIDPERHELKILDLMFSGEDYLETVENTVVEFQPDLVGISLRLTAQGRGRRCLARIVDFIGIFENLGESREIPAETPE